MQVQGSEFDLFLPITLLPRNGTDQPDRHRCCQPWHSEAREALGIFRALTITHKDIAHLTIELVVNNCICPVHHQVTTNSPVIRDWLKKHRKCACAAALFCCHCYRWWQQQDRMKWLHILTKMLMHFYRLALQYQFPIVCETLGWVELVMLQGVPQWTIKHFH